MVKGHRNRSMLTRAVGPASFTDRRVAGRFYRPGIGALLTRALAIAALAMLATSWGLSRARSDPGSPSAAEPAGTVYGPEPRDPWNRLHAAIFRRDDASVEVLDEDMPDPPLWHDTRHLLREDAYARVLAALDDFAGQPRAQLTKDPLRAAVMQHDLWAAFDWAAAAPWDRLNGRRRELRRRLATAISKLTLAPEQIAVLPDNYARVATRERGTDPSPPADLLRPDGPWVCATRAVGPATTRPADRQGAPVAAGPDEPAAVIHTRAFGGRSAFAIFLNLPEGRAATEAYCRKLNQVPQAARMGSDLPQFPVGTRVALVRRMLLIDVGGIIRAAPLVETVQVRTFRALKHSPWDSQDMQEFDLRRRDLFAGGAGLAPVGLKQQMYEYHDLRDGPVDDPIEDRRGHAGHVDTPHLFKCGLCHVGEGIRSVNSFTGARFVLPHHTDLWPGDPAGEAELTARWKVEQKDWKLLRGAIAEQGKAGP